MPVRIRRYRDSDRKAVIAAFRTKVPDHFPVSEEAWLRSAFDEPDGPVDTHPHTAGFFARCGFVEIARWPGGYRSGRDRADLRFELTDDALDGLRVTLASSGISISHGRVSAPRS